MAYVNLIDATIITKAELFCRLRDFICKRNGTYDYSSTGIGWTLFDASYAVDEDNPQLNDWFVIYSPGESGNEDLFFHFSWVSSHINVKGYQAWNPSTNTGSSRYYCNSSNLQFWEAYTNMDLCIHGDLDFVFACIEYAGGTYYPLTFGKLEPPNATLDTDTATCSTTLTAGSDVSIVLDVVPSGWYEGCEVEIRTTHTDNVSTVYMEHIVVKTISGNTITADLSYNYTSGAKLSAFNCYYAQGGTQFMNAGYCMFTPAEGVNPGGGLYNLSLISTAVDPCDFEDRYVLSQIFFQATTTGWPLAVFKHIRFLGVITSPMIVGDRVVDQNGDYWRIYTVYSAKYIAVREV